MTEIIIRYAEPSAVMDRAVTPSEVVGTLVRCKDCKWYECGGLPCPLDLCESLGDDGFCSRGERREE